MEEKSPDSLMRASGDSVRPWWRRRTWILVWVVMAGVVTHVGWRWSSLAGLQSCLERDWEIYFNDDRKVLPRSVSKQLRDGLEWLQEKGWLGQKRNRDVIYRKRIESLLRGPIRKLFIVDPRAVDDRLGRRLNRFVFLEDLEIDESGQTSMSELIGALDRTRRLERLSLWNAKLRLEEIETLCGWKQLRVLELRDTLAPGSLEILGKATQLETLKLDFSYSGSEEGRKPTQEAIDTLKRALPATSVEVKTKPTYHHRR